jgi:hypothetical protein
VIDEGQLERIRHEAEEVLVFVSYARLMGMPRPWRDHLEYQLRRLQLDYMKLRHEIIQLDLASSSSSP